MRKTTKCLAGDRQYWLEILTPDLSITMECK